MRFPDLGPKTSANLVLAAGAVLAGWAGMEFLDLADDIHEGDTDTFDNVVLHWVARHRSAAVTYIFLTITALGAWPVLSLLTLGTCTALLLSGERRFALTLLAAMVGAPILGSGFKNFFDRERPSVMPHLETVVSSSFPSGHTIAAVVFFVTVALLIATHTRRHALRLFLIPYALLVAALVAISRIYLGVHYPSDVAGGALLGIAWSLACVIADRMLPWKRHAIPATRE